MRKLLLAAAAAIATAGAASAAPVTFDIIGGGYLLGSGFGCPNNNTNQFLCVTANNTMADPAPFTLSAGASKVLTFGVMVNIDEGQFTTSGSNPESDNLDLTVYLDFAGPFGGQISRLAAVAATGGAWSDAADDLVFTFAPIVQGFGDGGSFTVEFSTIAFSDSPQTLMHFVTITLNAEGAEPTASASEIPEPGSIALLGAGLIGLPLLRRRRA